MCQSILLYIIFNNWKIRCLLGWPWKKAYPCTNILECFEMMHLEGAQPNAIAFVSMLKVCGSMQAADRNTNGSILECFEIMQLEGA